MKSKLSRICTPTRRRWITWIVNGLALLNALYRPRPMLPKLHPLLLPVILGGLLLLEPHYNLVWLAAWTGAIFVFIVFHVAIWLIRHRRELRSKSQSDRRGPLRP